MTNVDAVGKKPAGKIKDETNEQFFNRIKAECDARHSTHNDLHTGKDTQIFVAAFHYDKNKPGELAGVILSKTSFPIMLKIMEELAEKTAVTLASAMHHQHNHQHRKD